VRFIKIFLFLLFLSEMLLAKYNIPALKRDDFAGKKTWWEFHQDGTAKQDRTAIVFRSGYLILSLNNPLADRECNVGFSERQNIYGKSVKKLVVETRIKVLNSMRPGSRGWGFWKAARNGVADNLAWFMQQLLPGNAKLSWQRVGSITPNQKEFGNFSINDQNWHTYKIIRDLKAKTTLFYVDRRQIFSTPKVSPKGKMSFHLWVDNQVYSQKRGIQPQGWKGSSRMVIDYVQIRTAPKINTLILNSGNIALFAQPAVFGPGGEKQPVWQVSFKAAKGETVILATARAEANQLYDIPDKLSLLLDGQVLTSLQGWDGSRLQGQSRCRFFKVKTTAGEHGLKFISSSTPLLFDVTVLNKPGCRVLLNREFNKIPCKDENAKLWREFTFTNQAGLCTFYISASLKETTGWDHIRKLHGPGDQLRATIDGQKNASASSQTLQGKCLFGDSGVILFQKRLSAGTHHLKLFTSGFPYIQRLLIYGPA